MKAMDALSLDVSAAAIHPLAAETTPTEAALNEEAAISLSERDTRGATGESNPRKRSREKRTPFYDLPA